MPKVGWIPEEKSSNCKSKLIVWVDLWGNPKLYSMINGQKRAWNNSEEARDFASKNGFSGIKCKTER